MSCAICEKRKEKRFCPAVHGRICPQCCGEQREVTLDCPSDCVYLQQAREHEKPRPMAELDRPALRESDCQHESAGSSSGGAENDQGVPRSRAEALGLYPPA